MSPHRNHTAGIFRHGHIDGLVGASVDTVEEMSFRLDLADADGVLQVKAVAGMPGPEQVLRALGRHGVIRASGDAADRLEVRLKCTDAVDEASYSADLKHRLRYRRVYTESGPVVTWFGFNPFLADLEGDPSSAPPRPSLRNMVKAAQGHLGGVGTFNVLNLFTRRSAEAVDIAADDGDRLVHDDLVVQTIADSDLVIGAWGGKVGDRHLPQVRRLLDLLDDHGLTLHVPARGDSAWMTTAWPRQPRHPSRLGYKSLGLVPAPAAWLNDLGFGDMQEDDRLDEAVPNDVAMEAGPLTPPASSSTEPTDSHERQPRSTTAAAVSPRTTSLRDRMVIAGASSAAASDTVACLKRWSETGQYDLARTALCRLLRGETRILHDGGATELELPAVLRSLLRRERSPEERARSLVVGAVAVGGGSDDEWPAWRHMVDHGRPVRPRPRPDLVPVHPCPGVMDPGHARRLYALLVDTDPTASSLGTRTRGGGPTLGGHLGSPRSHWGW